METVSRFMESLAVATTWLASFINPSAVLAFSALFLVMEAISSMEEEVSSMEAACSEAPSAMDWLAEDTCPDADATWSEPSFNPEMIRFTGLVMLRVMKNADNTPTTRAMIRPMIMTVEAMDNESTAPVAMRSVAVVAASAVSLAPTIIRVPASFLLPARFSISIQFSRNTVIPFLYASPAFRMAWIWLRFSSWRVIFRISSSFSSIC